MVEREPPPAAQLRRLLWRAAANGWPAAPAVGRDDLIDREASAILAAGAGAAVFRDGWNRVRAHARRGRGGRARKPSTARCALTVSGKTRTPRS